MNDILCRQLALDYCCSPDDVRDRRNHFSVYRRLDGRRRFNETEKCFFKAAVVNGKILFTGDERIIAQMRERYGDTGGEWFFEVKNLRRIADMLREYGYRIEMVHPFYIAEKTEPVETGELEIRRYYDADIGQFRGDKRFGEAFCFSEDAPDVIGIAALRGGEIVGMAGASCDSPLMWQIGINVEPDARRCGAGKTLVALLKNEILGRGKLPFYGTSVSHIASQRTALAAGFLPAWAELTTVQAVQSA